jgi:hypothetical protein
MKHRDEHQTAAGRKGDVQENQHDLEDEDMRELDPENEELDADELDDEDRDEDV